MSTTCDIAVIGAGIVGSACAAECAAGGLKVLVIDRGPVGGGTTGSSMGHIVVMDDSEPQFALTSYSRTLWAELAGRLPEQADYKVSGTLWIAADDEEMQEVHRKQKFYSERGIKVEVLDAAGIANCEPNLRKNLAGGLRVPDDAVVYPPATANFLLEQAKTKGAKVRTGIKVESISTQGDIVLADASRISAGIIINAAGCWSPDITPGLPVFRRKGHLVITDRYPGFLTYQTIELGYLKSAHSVTTDSIAFNIHPRKNGQMLIGSSRQADAGDTTIDPNLLQRMLRRAAEYVPTINRLSAIRAWTGHRPATSDKLPLIGPSLEDRKIWLATGHEGLGITTSLATGRLLADLILKRPTAIPAAPYFPARLAKGDSHHG